MEVGPSSRTMKKDHLTWSDIMVHGVNRPSLSWSYISFWGANHTGQHWYHLSASLAVIMWKSVGQQTPIPQHNPQQFPGLEPNGDVGVIGAWKVYPTWIMVHFSTAMPYAVCFADTLVGGGPLVSGDSETLDPNWVLIPSRGIFTEPRLPSWVCCCSTSLKTWCHNLVEIVWIIELSVKFFKEGRTRKFQYFLCKEAFY